MKKLRIFYFLMFIILFNLFCSTDVMAKPVASDFSAGSCVTETIPSDATSNYTVVGGKFVLSDMTYASYLKQNKDFEEIRSKGHRVITVESEFLYAFFAISNNGLTLKAYVPNYKATLLSNEGLQAIKIMGLYNEEQKDCSGTYVTNATIVDNGKVVDKTDYKIDVFENPEKYKEKLLNDQSIYLNKDNNNSNIFSFKSIFTICVVIMEIGIIISLVLGRKNKKKTSQPYVYSILVTISVVSLLALHTNTSYSKETDTTVVENMDAVTDQLDSDYSLTHHDISLTTVKDKKSQMVNSRPSKVTQLRWKNLGSNYVLLIWNSVPQATNYELCYVVAGEKEICKMVGNVSTYRLKGLKASTSYSIRVRGYNNSLIGSFSEVLKITTKEAESSNSSSLFITDSSKDTVPKASGLSVVYRSDTTIILNWNEQNYSSNTSNMLCYSVFSTGKTTCFKRGSRTIDIDIGMITNLTPQTLYEFWVQPIKKLDNNTTIEGEKSQSLYISTNKSFKYYNN